jgi:hypothetical protein
MECPFCTETIKDGSLVCGHCTRDLTLVRPVIFEIQEMIVELDELQRQLGHTRTRLALVETPGRFLLVHAAAFVLLPSVTLVAAHFLITVALDMLPIYLRIVSVLIPLPFGFALAVLKNIGFRGAVAFGVATAALSIPGMLAVTAFVDGINLSPSNWREWREVLEYGTSIALAFGAGNILATLLFQTLPRTLRRRAGLIQDVLRIAGPLLGFLAAVFGSIYTGLKGMLAQ